MRLLIFSPYYLPHIGGVENYTKDFCEHLSKEGFSVTIFTPRLPDKSLEKELVFENVKIIRFPAFEIIPNYPLPKFWSFKFYKLYFNLFSENYHKVICQTRFFFTSLLALFYVYYKNGKLINIEHGSSFVQNENSTISFLSRIYDKSLGKLVLEKSSCVIAISKAVSEFVKELAPKATCNIIYRGFNIDVLDCIVADESIKKNLKGKTIVTYIGRLINGKGILDLLKAIKLIERSDYHLIIVGAGPQKKELEEYVLKNNLEKQVSFEGLQSFKKAIAILKASDIFINPSYSEGLPTTVVEAALCKKAIIATDVGGTREIIKNSSHGILIKPRNPQMLKEKIEYLLNLSTEKRVALGEKARQEAIQTFSWNKTIKLFKKTLNA